MRILQSLIFCSILVMLPQSLDAQLSTANLYATQDSYTHSNIGNSNTNYGNNTSMLARREYFVSGSPPRSFVTQSYQRTFVQFNLGSIPSNAIIYSAELRLNTVGSVSGLGLFTWKTRRVQASWSESTITHTNQPAVSSLSNDLVTTTPVSSGQQKIDVTDMVQRMVYGAADNYGWRVQVDNESTIFQTGGSFYTSEYWNQFSRPQLIVEYYLPVTLSNVVVTHESGAGQSDGSISFSHTALDATGHTYTWVNSSGVQLQSGSTLNLDDLEYGWYGLKIEGNTNGETFYYAFLVGLQCDEVTIQFDPDDNYIDNALNSNLINNGIDNGNTNGGNNANFQSSRESFNNNDYSTNSLMKFRLWVPNELIVNQADLTLKGISHVGANAAEFDKVTSDWNEALVTWNNSPTSVSTTTVSIPMSLFATDAVISTLDFWNDWKANNANNHGVQFQLSNYGSPTNRQRYHSPTSTNASDRPKIDFKVALWEDECVVQHAHLDYEMDGYYHVMQNGKIRFIYDQQYDTDELGFNIYDYHDNLVKTEADFPAIATTHGENYLTVDVSTLPDCIGRGFFYLEVITSKKEKLYMRFFNDFSLPGCTDSHPDPGGNPTE